MLLLLTTFVMARLIVSSVVLKLPQAILTLPKAMLPNPYYHNDLLHYTIPIESDRQVQNWVVGHLAPSEVAITPPYTDFTNLEWDTIPKSRLMQWFKAYHYGATFDEAYIIKMIDWSNFDRWIDCINNGYRDDRLLKIIEGGDPALLFKNNLDIQNLGIDLNLEILAYQQMPVLLHLYLSIYLELTSSSQPSRLDLSPLATLNPSIKSHLKMRTPQTFGALVDG